MGSFRSPKIKRLKRAGIIDIGNWPSPATAANPPPSRRAAKITTAKTTRPVRTFSMSPECSIGHLDEGYHHEGYATIPQMCQSPGKRRNRRSGMAQKAGRAQPCAVGDDVSRRITQPSEKMIAPARKTRKRGGSLQELSKSLPRMRGLKIYPQCGFIHCGSFHAPERHI
jgi:hypothetical protein